MMVPKSSEEFKAVWNGIQLALSEKEYDIAMAHVEHMRQKAADRKYYENSEDDDDDIPEPDEPEESEEWRLSDTLSEALKGAKVNMKWKGLSAADLIKEGLKELSEELRGIDPCSDDDADDVF